MPAPHCTMAPLHEPASQVMLQLASPQVMSRLPHASLPSPQSMEHAYALGHCTVATSHESVPEQVILHAYSWGQTMLAPSHELSPMQSMAQTLPGRQPPLQAGGHAPAPGGNGSIHSPPPLVPAVLPPPVAPVAVAPVVDEVAVADIPVVGAVVPCVLDVEVPIDVAVVPVPVAAVSELAALLEPVAVPTLSEPEPDTAS